MPANAEVELAITGLLLTAEERYSELCKEFNEMATGSAGRAIEAYGAEIVETERYVANLRTMQRDTNYLRGWIEHITDRLIGGHWQPASKDPFVNAVNQMQDLACCKTIQRLRAILAEAEGATNESD